MSMLFRLRASFFEGTRGPLDMIEIPSHLFEHFLTSSEGAKICCKGAGGDAIPEALSHALLQQQNVLPALEMNDSVRCLAAGLLMLLLLSNLISCNHYCSPSDWSTVLSVAKPPPPLPFFLSFFLRKIATGLLGLVICTNCSSLRILAQNTQIRSKLLLMCCY